MYYRDNLLDWWTIIESMPKEYWAAIIGAAATVLLTYLVSYLTKKSKEKGDVIVEQHNLQLRYMNLDYNKILSAVRGNVIFSNSSEKSKNVKISGMRLFDGKNYYKLMVENAGLLPSFSVDANNQYNFPVNFNFGGKIQFPILDMDVTYLELEYITGNKKHIVTIKEYSIDKDWFAV